MAVFVNPMMMPIADNNALHPFFQRAGHQASRSLTPVNFSSSGSINATHLAPQQGDLTEPKEQQQENYVHADLHRDSRAERHSQRHTIRACLERHTAKPTSQKRRKLSPEGNNTGTSWLEQLVTEAERPVIPLAQGVDDLAAIGPDGLGEAERRSATLPPASQRLSTEGDPQIILASALVQRPPLPLEHQPSMPSPTRFSMKLGEHNADFNTVASQRRSQRVLHLNGKGRLESTNPCGTVALPNIDGTLDPIRPNHRKRRKNSLVVVLSYGRHDDGKRREIGQTISSIQGIAQLTQPAPKSEPFMTQAINPYKPTHPFFTGKATQRKETDNVTAISIASKNHSAACPPISHSCRSFSTPGKMRHQAVVFKNSVLPQLSRAVIPPSVRAFRLPGTYEATWPSADLAIAHHTPSDLKNAGLFPRRAVFQALCGRRKHKDKSMFIDAGEDIILEISRNLVAPFRNTQHEALASLHSSKLVCLPERLVITGQELRSRSVAEVANLQSHPAFGKMAANLEYSQSLHDASQSNTIPWAQKYAPKSAAETLQAGKEMTVLRDWLKDLTVAAVESGIVQLNQGRLALRSTSTQPEYARRRKRRRRMSDELDGFVISSDEEQAEMQELSETENSSGLGHKPDFRSIIQNSHMVDDRESQLQRKSNTVLLSGPHGSGKTAAAYAVARELGFEIFEINPGSRRSGKDVLDKVGDMARNHQVRKAQNTSHDGTVMDDEDMPADLPCELQRTLGSFFGTATKKKQFKKRHLATTRKIVNDQEKATQQKQSLILLEEVDILFEEDKSFWETVLELAIQSKRPIIMTCNDETCVPLNVLALHAILRFRPPSSDVAADYLLLLAAAEGHLLSRDAIATLYQANNYDLRASIMDLNFWCQMAVGDDKGGMEWYLKRWPPGADLDIDGQLLKVVSSGTFHIGMAVDGHTQVYQGDCRSFFAEKDFLVDVWRNWGVDPMYASDEALNTLFIRSYDEGQQQTPSDGYHLLKEFQMCLDDRSAMDVFCQVDLPATSYREEFLDPTAPPMPEASLSNYIIGHPLLQADIREDFTQFDTQIATTMHLAIRDYWAGQKSIFTSSTGNRYAPTSAQEKSIREINRQRSSTAFHTLLSRSDFSTALDPLAECVGPSNLGFSGMQISSFDRNFSIVVEDLAPYVRSIVAYDQALEQQREAFNNLLSQGARSGKPLRTTRASRSALEGSQRANTRRERWFPKTLNLDLVMRTAGKDWPQPGVSNIQQGISLLHGVGSLRQEERSRSASVESVLQR